MPVRKLNFTGRKKLRKTDVRIVLHEGDGGSPTFDAEFMLGGYSLPGDAQVFVEARRQTAFMRFPMGTVAAALPPADRRLYEFDSTDGIQFRVKVTSTDGEDGGKLVAVCERISVVRPGEPPVDENRTPLLIPVPDSSLGDEICRVSFSEGDQVELRINSQLGDWKAAARTPVFMALVYPMAMREVLTRVLIIDRNTDDEDDESWQSQWLQFACSLPGVPRLPETSQSGEHEEWIDDAVSSFCRQFQMLQKSIANLTGESAS